MVYDTARGAAVLPVLFTVNVPAVEGSAAAARVATIVTVGRTITFRESADCLVLCPCASDTENLIPSRPGTALTKKRTRSVFPERVADVMPAVGRVALSARDFAATIRRDRTFEPILIFTRPPRRSRSRSRAVAVSCQEAVVLVFLSSRA